MGCSQGKLIGGLRSLSEEKLGGFSHRRLTLRRSLSEELLEKIMQYTNLEQEQVEAKYRQFLTKHPKGRISKKSFQSMLTDCFPGINSAKLGLLGSHIWRIYDLNEDGQIDFYEFMTVLHVMSKGSSEDNLRQIFRVFDINRDGRISKEELEKIVDDFQLNNAGDGCLVNSVFNEMDENEDGEISPEEFIEACMAQKKISTMLTLKIIDIFIVD
eukprot:GFUD01026833.1.p1 GENE.GFUD01026833.1~~GFUD01026833.1.p1  ORF type:complete len:214 (-),score=51.50 GFUD01026833.1:99-740(-)